MNCIVKYASIVSLCAAAGISQAPLSYLQWTLSASGVSVGRVARAREHTLAVVPSGSPSGCSLKLEGSIDGSAWFDLSGAQTCTSNLMFHVTQKPVNQVRVNLVTLSGGTSPSLDVQYLGVQ